MHRNTKDSDKNQNLDLHSVGLLISWLLPYGVPGKLFDATWALGKPERAGTREAGAAKLLADLLTLRLSSAKNTHKK